MLEEADRLAEPGRSAADAVARRDAGRRTLSRETRRPAARSPRTSSQHLGVLAEEKGQSIVVERDGAPRRRWPTGWCCGRRSSTWWTTPSSSRRAAAAFAIRVAETPATAVIDVIDTGPGIPAEARGAHLRSLLSRRRGRRRARRRPRPVDCEGRGRGQRRPADARAHPARRAARSGSPCPASHRRAGRLADAPGARSRSHALDDPPARSAGNWLRCGDCRARCRDHGSSAGAGGRQGRCERRQDGRDGDGGHADDDHSVLGRGLQAGSEPPKDDSRMAERSAIRQWRWPSPATS